MRFRDIAVVPNGAIYRRGGAVYHSHMKSKALLPFFILIAVLAARLDAGDPQKAIAILAPTEGNKTKGTVTFTATGNTVQVTADISGLTPGKHAFHIHEYGDCSSPDANSAGNHFNPANKPHAGHDVPERHVGDLGNLDADGTGRARLDVNLDLIKLAGPNSVIGLAVIVHANPDDLKSQPGGNAGGRVACGVIGIAK